SMLSKVLINGQKKPVSEIVKRTNNQIEKYAIYDKILKSLLPDACQDISNELKTLEDPTNGLINKFHGNNAESLNYEDITVQSAYMLCYFPYYIENIYHLLHYIECAETRHIFKNDMNINLYGCGPAPDLLGLVAFLNKKYGSKISHINVNFFDKHDWTKLRNECVNNYAKLFNHTINIETNNSEINLLECDNAEYVVANVVDDSQLHVFQNCTTDIYTQCKSYHKIGAIFNTFCNHMSPESVAIIIDFLGKGDSMTILNSIKKKLAENAKIKILDNTYNVDEFIPNFIQNADVQSFLNHCYKKAQVEPRKSTGYTYLAVQRRG
ncbi:hypothetical protein, partial [Methanoregula sp.]|uniref:hypothetical protein n=1 Tax=Methanoregula sp. TaxID=2052170 RepID=UPI003BB096BB